MADEYTPTTEDARDDYRRARYYLDDAPEDNENYRSGGPEFDRWLAAHDAEVARAAAEKAWDEGYDKGLSDGQRDDGYVTANPYRADRLAGGESRG